MDLRGRIMAFVEGGGSRRGGALHKGPRVTELIHDCGAWPLFLPPYPPDLNPIEMAFAKINELLRKQNARTIEALLQAIGDICNLFTPQVCWNFLREDGYVHDLT